MGGKMSLLIVILQFGHQLSVKGMGHALAGHEAMAYAAICDLIKQVAKAQAAAMESFNEGPNKTTGGSAQSNIDIP